MIRSIILSLFILPVAVWAHGKDDNDHYWLAVKAKDKFVRTALTGKGMSIESIVDDMSYGFAPKSIVDDIKASGYEVTATFPSKLFQTLDFPIQDAIYHNHAEMTAMIDDIVAAYPKLVHKISMGRSLEGREMWGVRINPNAVNGTEPSGLPGVVFMGGHHAREHLSMETPLLYIKHLAENYGTDAMITDLLNRRDIYIFPMINPDGSEFDIASGQYQMWRKNRRDNGGGRCAGVDLNRNYGYKWGTGGSSNSPCSDVYMGPTPFSEPETQAVKRFVESRTNLKVLLSFHTYSELILYPWGGTYDPVPNAQHRSAFVNMANTMARWNGYTPQQSSELYIASGDTVDWAYGALGIFAFTFELSPKDAWGGGGFYPGVGAIETTFQANLKPVLYLIDLADNPVRAATNPETTLFFGR